MADKHIIIGLGGSGIRTVAMAKSNLLESGKGLDNCRFLFIDADEREIRYTNERQGNIIKLSEVLVLESTQKTPESSQMAFERRLTLFQNMLETDINGLFSDEERVCTSYLFYWIVSGTCGSVGCGVTPMVIEAIHSIHEKDAYKNIIDLTCHASYMPGMYLQMNPMAAGLYAQNAKSFFSRLVKANELKEPGMPKLCIAIDSRDSAGNDWANIDIMYKKSSELLSLLTSSGAKDTLWAMRDIYVDSLQAHVNGPECLLTTIGFSNNKESAEKVFFPLTEEGKERIVYKKTLCLGPPEEVEKLKEILKVSPEFWLFLPDYSVERVTYISFRIGQSIKDYALLKL